MTPAIVLANAGTPLMWATCFHLFIGNALIGWFEAGLISRALRVPRSRRLLLSMIAANYLSAAAGVAGLQIFSEPAERWLSANVTIYNVLAFHAVALVAAYLFTLLLEWPFVHVALPPPRAARRSLLANCLAQSVSYVLLFVLYGLLSSGMLRPFGPVRAVSIEEIGAPAAGWAYYVPLDRDALWRVRLDGSQRERVCDVNVSGEPTRLFAAERDDGQGHALYLETDDRVVVLIVPVFSGPPPPPPEGHLGEYVLRSQIPPFAATQPSGGNGGALVLEVPPRSPFVAPVDLRPEDDRDWNVRAGFWAAQGIWATDTRSGKRLRVAFSTALLDFWAPRYAFLLPGGQVAYQLGAQIVLLDLNRREIALLGLGAGLVVTLDSP